MAKLGIEISKHKAERIVLFHDKKQLNEGELGATSDCCIGPKCGLLQVGVCQGKLSGLWAQLSE